MRAGAALAGKVPVTVPVTAALVATPVALIVAVPVAVGGCAFCIVLVALGVGVATGAGVGVRAGVSSGFVTIVTSAAAAGIVSASAAGADWAAESVTVAVSVPFAATVPATPARASVATLPGTGV
jgi:hypothetical protein